MELLEPLRFAPVFKNMLWGGHRLPEYLGVIAPIHHPIGEAWILSDVPNSESRIVGGTFAGKTLRSVIEQHPVAIFGKQIPPDGRFPLLLKFIDARLPLSVQVHPNDEQAVAIRGPGHRGKTEAWVVLDADPQTSALYAGFKPGMSAERFRQALAEGTVAETLHRMTPSVGDCLFLEAGTVHAIGADLLIFEIQQTSDITFRLYDWDRIDAATGLPRQLHVEEALKCSHFAGSPCMPVQAQQQGDHEVLVDCAYFRLTRQVITQPTKVGRPGVCQGLVVLAGKGEFAGDPIRRGEVALIPAALGQALLVPTEPMTILNCSLG